LIRVNQCKSVERKSSAPGNITITAVYSAELLDHFQNPRNGGELQNADAIARVENPACGDMLELSLKLDGDRIADIRFRAKGCVPTMACGSAITELTKGKTITAAREIRRGELLKMVGGLPESSNHAGHLALDALSALLGKFPHGRT
jgi:nitrogen fixation protein NifU and related proteins